MSLSIFVPVTATQQEAALSLLFSPLPADLRQQQMLEAFAAVKRREFSLDDLVMATDRDQVLGTVLAVRRPGGAAFLWPPVVRAGADTNVLSALLEFVALRLDAQGVQFTQCLLDPDDTGGREALARDGFPYVTDLILLSRSLSGSLPPAPQAELSSECYSAELHSAFARIVERTYVGTLDCPVLAQLRSGEDSLTAHRATGHFLPTAWRLYRSAELDVGVLLLAEHPERDTWEVAYLGVIPEARGQGIGRAILNDGLKRAKSSGRSTMEIAVDVGNLPALRLYRAVDFTDVRQYSVHLRLKQSC